MANEHNYLSRTIIASFASVVLTFISWVGALYVTLGVEVAGRMDYEPILSNFGKRIKIAFAVDCVAWFAMTWGTQGLWTQFRKDLRAMAMGLAACALAICGLFAVAVRFWPDAWVPKHDSDNSKVTTLNLR